MELKSGSSAIFFFHLVNGIVFGDRNSFILRSSCRWWLDVKTTISENWRRSERSCSVFLRFVNEEKSCSSRFIIVGNFGILFFIWIAIRTSRRRVRITDIKVVSHNIIQMVRYLQDWKSLLYKCEYSLLSASYT